MIGVPVGGDDRLDPRTVAGRKKPIEEPAFGLGPARGEDHDISVVSIHAKRVVEEVEEEAPAAESGEAGEEAKGEGEGES